VYILTSSVVVSPAVGTEPHASAARTCKIVRGRSLKKNFREGTPLATFERPMAQELIPRWEAGPAKPRPRPCDIFWRLWCVFSALELKVNVHPVSADGEAPEGTAEVLADLDARTKRFPWSARELLKAFEHLAFRALRLEPAYHEKIHIDCGGLPRRWRLKNCA